MCKYFIAYSHQRLQTFVAVLSAASIVTIFLFQEKWLIYHYKKDARQFTVLENNTNSTVFRPFDAQTISETIGNHRKFISGGSHFKSSVLDKKNNTGCFDGKYKNNLLTLFTTWPENEKKKSVINITCFNWAVMIPHVQPVLFTDNSMAADICSKRGWKRLPVGKTAAGGVPVLKHMFLRVRKKFNSVFYGFANGDILFVENLLTTLSAIFLMSKTTDLNHILLTGRRTNVVNVTFSEARTFENLTTVAKQRGKLFIPMSADYFITDNEYPWGVIPDIVIGRRGYDNWLVLNALRHHHYAIDVTKTVLAVHQTTKAGNREGFSRKHSLYNINLLSRLYNKVPYDAGSTTCTKQFTTLSDNGEVIVKQRTKFPTYC